MIDFLYKSSLSLLVLLAIYHLVLEKQKMHQFNRFYLLFGIAFSLVLPFITIQVATETIVPVQQTYRYVIGNVPIQNTKTIEQSHDYTSLILWCLYGLLTSVFLFRYVRNIVNIVSVIKSNPVIEDEKARYVLVAESILPHTFLNYIFLNKADYQNQKIEKELFRHEMVHVTQKHTLDILFIETLKTIFWFNPLFIFYKKAIQLNHEFLADENVVNSFKDVSYYQNLLLAYSSANATSGLTSNLNYSITKKRFIMMTKTVSKKRVLISKIVLLPLFSGLIFFVCVEGVAQIKRTSGSQNDEFAENTAASNGEKNTVEKNEANRPQIMMQYSFREKKLKVNEANVQLLMNELGTYIGGIYKTPEGLKKDEEIASIAFSLKRDGSITDFQIIDEKGNKAETKLFDILKSSPKLTPSKNETDDNWDKITIRMDFWAKNPSDPRNQDNPLHVIPGVFGLPGTFPSEDVDVRPKFIGDITELNQNILKKYKGKATIYNNGKISIGFAVETDGSPSNFTYISDIKTEEFNEMISILKNTKWTPGKLDGKAVRTSYVFQVPILGDKK